MSRGYAPSELPLYETQAVRDEKYQTAEREETPFFAVERYEEGYGVTYDLLPTGYELSKPARKELEEQLTREVESIVGDPSSPTVEVSKTVGVSLGNVSLFDSEEAAREVGAIVARTVLDESNWVEASPPEHSTGAEFRQN